MYPCSNAFHQAVAANEPQKAMFIFNDGVITNEDIDLDAGIKLLDLFCSNEDLSIGGTYSNELSFTLMNERYLLNPFPFGEFRALLGVRIGSGANQNGFSLSFGGHTYTTTTNAASRLLKDGTATASQPTFNIASMAALDVNIYCFGANGEVFAVSADTGVEVSVTGNPFMTDKAKRWAGTTYSYESRILTIRSGDIEETYEFVPLGVFYAERPAVVESMQLNITCNDRMKKLDTDMDLEITYPITLKNLLTAVCQSEGIPVESGTFINEDVVLTEAPPEFENCTKQDIVGWIAEAAASNAKITRDGALRLAWLQSTTVVFDENSYVECRPYHYNTAAVNRLCVRDLTEETDEFITGETGAKNTYLIQDNPLLR